MTVYEEIVERLPRLTVEEQVELLETISRTLRARMIGNRVYGSARTDASEITTTEGSAERLLGIIKTDGPPPNDEEVDQIRYEYLIKKYS
jgi:hypothetical protein